jgi:hypothetical protein
MDELYFYNKPFLNYYHPYSHMYRQQPDNNNSCICILIGLIIIIICVLCYLFCFNNKINNKNTFASSQATNDYNAFVNSNNTFTAKKNRIHNMDPSNYSSLIKQLNAGTLNPDSFENL